MKRILCSDWLSERDRPTLYLARSGLPALFSQSLCNLSYNKPFIDQANSVKMAGYRPRSSFFWRSVCKNAFHALRLWAGKQLRAGSRSSDVNKWRLKRWSEVTPMNIPRLALFRAFPLRQHS